MKIVGKYCEYLKISEFKILEITLTRNNEEYRSLRKIGKFYRKGIYKNFNTISWRKGIN